MKYVKPTVEFDYFETCDVLMTSGDLSDFVLDDYVDNVKGNSATHYKDSWK